MTMLDQISTILCFFVLFQLCGFIVGHELIYKHIVFNILENACCYIIGYYFKLSLQIMPCQELNC